MKTSSTFQHLAKGFFSACCAVSLLQAAPLPLAEQPLFLRDSRLPELPPSFDISRLIRQGAVISFTSQTRSQFDKAVPCSHLVADENAGLRELALGCLLLSTDKDQPIFQKTGTGIATPGRDHFDATTRRETYAFGMEFEPLPAAAVFSISLRLENAETGWVHVEVPKGETFLGVWSDWRFDRVEVRQCGENPEVTYTRFLTGCRPRLRAALPFENKAAFLARAGATSATGPLPRSGSGPVLRLGSVTILPAAGGALSVGETFWDGWPAAPADKLDSEGLDFIHGPEISVGGVEDINVCLGSPAVAFGFDIAEPTGPPDVLGGSGEPHIESTFTIRLFHEADRVGEMTFSPPNNQAAFWGVLSPVPFTRVEIRETKGETENEFFGQFYTTPCGCCCGEKPSAK